ncbi:MAG: Lrp/AsnC family transcriptional regulator [Nitrososphaerota archaeon]|nr:Lrp/AsnC family transcriptional regulator [Candidatus Bathyarchaeota archaeon]MDW8022279.1 Lrp/AsnC family transcriptional regulator [Nitrososphaerota archaeon]
MDTLDKEIIKILRQDGRSTYRDIAKRVGLSEGAVRLRVKRLMGSGVIRRFTVETGLPEGAEALSLISVNPSIPTSKISATLTATPNVKKVYEVTGEYDIAVIISASDISEVNECVEKIRKIEGVLNTNTMIVLRSW